jgi:uncharacterized protein (TIGR02246 family)
MRRACGTAKNKESAMNPKATLGAVALAVALAGCQKPPPCPTCPPPPAPPPKVDVNAEAEAIKALDAKLVEAIATKNADAVVAFYSSDAVFLPPNQDAKTGEALKQDWANMFAMNNASLTFAPTSVEVDEHGDRAIDIGTYTFSFDSDQGKVEDHGKYVEVWEKIDGQWKIAVDMYNTSVPMTPPAAAAPAKK